VAPAGKDRDVGKEEEDVSPLSTLKVEGVAHVHDQQHQRLQEEAVFPWEDLRRVEIYGKDAATPTSNTQLRNLRVGSCSETYLLPEARELRRAPDQWNLLLSESFAPMSVERYVDKNTRKLREGICLKLELSNCDSHINQTEINKDNNKAGLYVVRQPSFDALLGSKCDGWQAIEVPIRDEDQDLKEDEAFPWEALARVDIYGTASATSTPSAINRLRIGQCSERTAL